MSHRRSELPYEAPFTWGNGDTFVFGRALGVLGHRPKKDDRAHHGRWRLERPFAFKTLPRGPALDRARARARARARSRPHERSCRKHAFFRGLLARAAGHRCVAAARRAGGVRVGTRDVALARSGARDGAGSMAHDVAVSGRGALDIAAVADVDAAVAGTRAQGAAAVAAREDAVARRGAVQAAVGRALDVAIARGRADAIGSLADAVTVFAVSVDVGTADEQTDEEPHERQTSGRHAAERTAPVPRMGSSFEVVGVYGLPRGMPSSPLSEPGVRVWACMLVCAGLYPIR
jgi:hypothetical protein